MTGYTASQSEKPYLVMLYTASQSEKPYLVMHFFSGVTLALTLTPPCSAMPPLTLTRTLILTLDPDSVASLGLHPLSSFAAPLTACEMSALSCFPLGHWMIRMGHVQESEELANLTRELKQTLTAWTSRCTLCLPSCL